MIVVGNVHCRNTGDRSMHLKASSPGENPNRLTPGEPTT
jgi:hypothetical protein